MNVILNPDRTLKNRVSVSEATARDSSTPIDILDTDMFIANAPPIPDGLILPRLSSDGKTWSEGDLNADAKHLDALASSKKQEIKAAMNAVLSSGFTCSNGILMDAFQEDGASLDQGVRLAQLNNLTSMDIRDFNNVTHTVTVAEAQTMVIEVGNNWVTQWSHKCSLETQIDSLVANTQLPTSDPNYMTIADATTAIQSVKW